MKKAVICDVKRFAVHDGPGIRTTLFLKGCSLSCIWCHNPESIDHKPELAVYLNKCTGCGDCAAVCNHHQIVDGQHVYDRNACTACGKCVDACLFDALELYGKSLTPDEAATVVLEDRTFYTESGGGVTVSGGEPLLQADFCVELFKIMKKEGIHTAVDTCGNVPWTAFESVLPLTDMFLYDFKHVDSNEHKRLTGCGNELIKANLLKLSQTGKPIEIRMPLIPELNMAESDLNSAGQFLEEINNITKVRLLAYHSMAHNKYAAIGSHDTLPDIPSPLPEELEKAAEILKSYRLNTIY